MLTRIEPDHVEHISDDFMKRALRVMRTTVSLDNIHESLWDDARDYVVVLTLLRNGISCEKKSMDECRGLMADLGLPLDFDKETEFSLHKFPKDRRGEAGENFVCLRLLEYKVRCEKCKETYIDRMAYPAFKVGTAELEDYEASKKTPIQIKSMSTAKHGYAIHTDDAPRELFDGWYIIVIERAKKKKEKGNDPSDWGLFAHSDEIKARFERDGSRPMKHGKVRPHKTRKSLGIPRDLSGGWSEYLDPRGFLEDVFSEQKENNRTKVTN